MSIELLNDDCLVALKKLPANSVDSVCTDPPAGVGLHGASWDTFDAPGVIADSDPKAGASGRAHSHGIAGVIASRGVLAARTPFIEFITRVFTEVYRVLKPGAYGIVWALPRTAGWTSTGLEDAGFTVVTVLSHVFSTGFPKHRNEIRPASEHWIVIRKEPEGTVEENVAKYGTGALNIEACRVATSDSLNGGAYSEGKDTKDDGSGWKMHGYTGKEFEQPIGRWPGNFLLSHNENCRNLGIKQVQGQKTAERPPDPETGSGWGHKRQSGLISYPTDANGLETVPNWECVAGCAVALLETQSPGASKFFPQFEADPFLYQAKVSQDEKHAGTGSLYWRKTDEGYKPITFVEWAKLGDEEKRVQKETGIFRALRGQGNIHTTPKSFALMEWFLRLSTPPGGMTLDPFLGSGTTACAALLNGFGCIGIERDPNYFTIAQARIEYLKLRMQLIEKLPKPATDHVVATSVEPPKEPQVATGLKLSSERFAKLVRKASKKS